MAGLLSIVTDLLLVTASVGAAAYCMVLSRRLTRLGSFDQGIGSAIAVLSAQVEEMKTALGEAKAGSDGAGQHLNGLVRQAQDISAELEMMIAACHDFAETAIEVQNRTGTNRGAPEREVSADAALVAAEDPPDTGRRVAESDGAPPTAEDAPVPVFGSRRGLPEARDDDAVPMFRHRSGAGA